MSDRESYEKISAKEFKAFIELNFISFLSNMEHLNIGELSFPEWYETFGAWLEVGTDMEETYYTTADACSDEECKICP
jgi:hypothetical protein